MEKGQKQDVSSALCHYRFCKYPAKSIQQRHLAIGSVSCQLPLLLAILGRVGSGS